MYLCACPKMIFKKSWNFKIVIGVLGRERNELPLTLLFFQQKEQGECLVAVKAGTKAQRQESALYAGN